MVRKIKNKKPSFKKTSNRKTNPKFRNNWKLKQIEGVSQKNYINRNKNSRYSEKVVTNEGTKYYNKNPSVSGPYFKK